MFFATINWYNDYEDVSETEYAMIPAKSMVEAIEKIANVFPSVEKVSIEDLCSSTDAEMVFIPAESIQRIRDINTY